MELFRLFFHGKRKWISLVVLISAIAFSIRYYKSLPTFTEIPLKRTNILRTVYGLGTVQAERVFHLKLGITTQITTLYVREGDLVKKGAPLVLFDQLPVMKAPFGGVVSTLNYKVGESVFPQNTVLTILDPSKKYISVALDENAAVLVRRDQKVRIAFEGLPGKLISGQVQSIYPSEGQFILNVQSNELPDEVLPGMSADLAVEAGKKENVFVVPTKSVKENKITLIQKGKKNQVQVQLGITRGDQVEISSSEISEGDILQYLP